MPTRITAKVKSDGTIIARVQQNSVIKARAILAGPRGPQGNQGDQGSPGADGEGVPEGGTTGQILKKLSDADFDTAWQDGGGSQTYDEYIFNSDGDQEENRYNSWADLYTALLTGQEGYKRVTFEQPETLPVGDYNLDNVVLSGDGKPAGLGGFAITLPDGFNVTSWINGGLDGGLRVTYEGTDPLITVSSGINLFDCKLGNGIECTNAPFFKIEGSSIFIITLRYGSNILDAGYEVFDVSGTGVFIISCGNNNASVQNNTIRGDATGLAMGIIPTEAGAGIDPDRTDENLIGTILVQRVTKAALVGFDPTGLVHLTEDNVDGVLREIDALLGTGGDGGIESVVSGGSNLVIDSVTDPANPIIYNNSYASHIGTYSYGSDSINFYYGASGVDIDTYSPILGDLLRVRTAGSKDFGLGTVTGEVGDYLIYDGTNWRPIYNRIPLALGELSTDAYRGDRGKTAYDHSQLTSGNPHNVTKTDVGLGNVDNTSDTNKPVSTAQQTALDGKQPIDSDLTAIAALTPTNDDVVQRKAGAWVNRSMAQLKTDLSLAKGDVGLGNVDNTSDANKPVSTAQQTALNLKLDSSAYDDATTAETDTGTSTTKYVSPDGLAGSYAGTKAASIYAIGASTTITTGDGKAYLRIPTALNGMDLVSCSIAVITKSTSGLPTVQLARGRQANATTAHAFTDMLSTKLTIDANEYDSKDAATPAVIDTSNDDVLTGDLIRVDVDVAGTGTAGLIVTLGFRLP